jgi:phage terminase small subunit
LTLFLTRMLKPKEKNILSRRQQLFIDEYMQSMNVTRAALAAGYSKKAPSASGQRMLRIPIVRDTIKRLLDERAEKVGISKEKVLNEIACIAFHDPRVLFNDYGELLPVKQWPDSSAAAISSIRVIQMGDGKQATEIKFWDKGKQLELAGKHLGLFGPLKDDSDGVPEPVQITFTVKDARLLDGPDP